MVQQFSSVKKISTDKLLMKIIIYLIFISFSFESYSSNIELSSSVELYSKVNKAIRNTGSIKYEMCSTKEDSIDRTTHFPEYEKLIDPNEGELDISAISMEYLNEVFDEISNNSEIPFTFAERGCEAQAHKIAKLLEDKGIISAKAFLQGPRNESLLKFKTKHSPKGYVNWEHHVAPVVKVKTGRKKTIEIKTGWFSTKKVMVDEYVNMVIDPTTSKRPIELSKWKKKFVTDDNKDKVSTFFTKRFNFFAADKYRESSGFSERDDFNMMSGLDIGLSCIENRKNKIADRRCDSN